MGWVSEICAPTDLDSVTQKYVNELLSRSLCSFTYEWKRRRRLTRGSAPGAMATIKDLVAYVSTHTHTDNLAKVEKVFAETVHSKEARYGMSCFLTKQTPDWSLVSKL